MAESRRNAPAGSPREPRNQSPAELAAGCESTSGRRRIAVAGGYTAGHVLAGLAFLKTYRETFGAEGCFIGCPGGVEERLVPAHGERLLLISGAAFARQGPWGRLTAIAGLFRGAMQARRMLRREGIELVIGVGGYASLGAGLAAWSLGVPLVIHEANAHPGLANLLLARLAQRVCVGFEEAAPRLGKSRIEYTGNPAAVGPSKPGSSGPSFLGTSRSPGKFRILVSGGSLGSPFLNREAPRLLAKLRALGCDFTVRHLAGTPHKKPAAATTDEPLDSAAIEEIRAAYAASGIEARVHPFTEDIASAYADADFVIGGAGALTLADVSAAGLPALLTPLSGAANDHQSDNARAYAAHTGALWVAERDWDAEKVAAQIADLLRNPERLDDMARRAHAFARPAAALDLVSVCEEVLGRAPVSDPAAGSLPGSLK